jgi:Domain of unknown function (DUF4288)
MKKRSAKERWFWAWIVQATVVKSERKSPHAPCEVWKNLVIVQASDETEAHEKAVAIGKAEQGDCQGTLRVNGKLAITRFLGIGDMGVVHDELADGCEILWQLKKCHQKTAAALPKDRKSLLEEVRQELLHS